MVSLAKVTGRHRAETPTAPGAVRWHRTRAQVKVDAQVARNWLAARNGRSVNLTEALEAARGGDDYWRAQYVPRRYAA